MVCLSIGMRIFTYADYLNNADRFAILNQMVVLLVMTLFIGLEIYFACVITPKLNLIYLQKKSEQYSEKLSKVR